MTHETHRVTNATVVGVATRKAWPVTMTLNIYFAGSIRAGRADASLYQRIVKILQRYGTVLTEHVGDPNLTEAGMPVAVKI